MGEQAWRGVVALAQDFALPGSATLGEAVRVRLEKRRREAIELLIRRIEQGDERALSLAKKMPTTSLPPCCVLSTLRKKGRRGKILTYCQRS